MSRSATLLGISRSTVLRVYQEWSTTQRASSPLYKTVGSIGVNMGQHPCRMLCIVHAHDALRLYLGQTNSQFFHGLHNHPLSMFGMLWIDVYDNVFQFPPISSNFTQQLKRSGTTFHRPHSTV